MPTAGQAGFFGKLSGAGDFVQRRLPADFVEPWDTHFQRAVAAAREQLRERWDDVYRTGPVWRFVLSPKVCGAGAWSGVMGPGADRVGRCFPLVIARASDPAAALADAAWHEAAARLLADTLAGGPATVEAFDRAVCALSGDDGDGDVDPARLAWSESRHWRLAYPSTGLLGGAWRAVVFGEASRAMPGCCLWWTAGEGATPATLLVTAGLPAPAAYVGLLQPGVEHAPWHSHGVFAVPARAPAVTPPMAILPAEDLPAQAVTRLQPVPAASAPRDAAALVLRRPECGLVAVAADTGGADPAQRAAQSVLGVIARADASRLAAGLWQLGTQLLALNEPLRAAGEDLVNPAPADCAVSIAQAVGGGSLLRIGGGGAWVLRRGRVINAFEPAANAPAPAAGAGDDPLGDLLAPAPAATDAGLGASAAPRFEIWEGRLEAGDRVLLWCAGHLGAASNESVARAFEAGTDTECLSRAARLAGLGGDPGGWPLAVLQVA